MNIIKYLKAKHQYIKAVKEAFNQKNAYFEQNQLSQAPGNTHIQDDFEVVARGGTVFLGFCILLRLGIVFLG